MFHNSLWPSIFLKVCLLFFNVFLSLSIVFQQRWSYLRFAQASGYRNVKNTERSSEQYVQLILLSNPFSLSRTIILVFFSFISFYRFNEQQRAYHTPAIHKGSPGKRLRLFVFQKEVYNYQNLTIETFPCIRYLSSNTSPPEYPHIDPSIVLDVMLASLYLRC